MWVRCKKLGFHMKKKTEWSVNRYDVRFYFLSTFRLAMIVSSLLSGERKLFFCRMYRTNFTQVCSTPFYKDPLVINHQPPTF